LQTAQNTYRNVFKYKLKFYKQETGTETRQEIKILIKYTYVYTADMKRGVKELMRSKY